MKIVKERDGILIKDCADFHPGQTFDCGQCFRFQAREDGSYQGVAFGTLAVFRGKENGIWIENVGWDDFQAHWHNFLDLDRDYAAIKESLGIDPVMREAIAYGSGIRILRQEFFECLISFILSQQNNIPKIKKAVEGIARRFGTRKEYRGKSYYTFPSARQLEGVEREDLAFLKIGYRDKYILDAVHKVLSGEIDAEQIQNLPYPQAKERLMRINGVGQKVADCVLLFSLGRFDAFPADTWIKKAMLALYGVEEDKIPAYSREQFGAYSGFAQQYIFYYARSKKITGPKGRGRAVLPVDEFSAKMNQKI